MTEKSSATSTLLSVSEAASSAAVARLLENAPVFLQPWWLEAVGGDACRYVVVWRGNEAAAAMPIFLKGERLGAPRILMPPSTHTLGPWFRKLEGSYPTRSADQKVLMAELIEGLPEFSYFGQQFHRVVTNWLPFFWQGFTQTTRYTYVLPDLSDLEAVWDGFTGAIRRNIRKAGKTVKVEEDSDIDRFFEIHEKTFARQGESAPHSREFLTRLDGACAEHGARKILFAVDQQGRTHAATFFIYSESSTIYLLSGADPELRSSGANCAVIWEGIQFASTVSKEFDFAGSMIEPIERFFRRFGARQVPYSQITKVNRSRLGRALRAGVSAFRSA